MKTDDDGRLWAREIQNCNGALIPREVTQNGKEAEASEVLWTTLTIDCAPKLACYNNGAGMGPDELHNFCHKMSWSGASKDTSVGGKKSVRNT